MCPRLWASTPPFDLHTDADIVCQAQFHKATRYLRAVYAQHFYTGNGKGE